ncbi:cysteine--tRNA ligase [Luedemannella flava]|uniref:Cysteine--tRNA ligase n=1 Tax=Luedemannella flava TaxID=349316 RepID=A0ABP4Y5U5_9ACTN
MTSGHPLKLYNSLGRRIEDFMPRAETVGLYSCGPTVYGYPHIGNMRAYVFADTLRRALRWKRYPVKHVINITDVGHAVAETNLGEDKLEAAAERERRSVEEIAQHYTQAFFDDLTALNILPADEYPRATAHVDAMIEFAAELESTGFAYRIPTGLYFDTSRSSGYGELGLIDVAGQLEGARVEQIAGRRNKTDFALWRAEASDQRRAMRWQSPWGWGAPGWHLECSVMSMHFLGSHFDLHTGGVDHRELHHVNEIAQSEAFLSDGERWVRYWLHNEFLQFNAGKMSKSEGGTVRVSDLADKGYHPMAYRLFLLGGHYRMPLDFTTDALEQTRATMRRLVARIEALRPLPQVVDQAMAGDAAGDDKRAAEILDQVDAAISADLNTPQVLALLQEALKDQDLTEPGRKVVVSAVEALLGLQLGTASQADFEQRRSRDDFSAADIGEIEQLVAARASARAERDWARADVIRQELAQRGIELTDTPTGTTWAPQLDG